MQGAHPITVHWTLCHAALSPLCRYFLHRLVCFNTEGEGWGNADQLEMDGKAECHHKASGLFPWRDSTRRNLLALTKAAHRKWHRDHKGVHRCHPAKP
jgi:hypothetical protein